MVILLDIYCLIQRQNVKNNELAKKLYYRIPLTCKQYAMSAVSSIWGLILSVGVNRDG